MGMRDIITHHYADLHAETVFYTCVSGDAKMYFVRRFEIA